MEAHVVHWNRKYSNIEECLRYEDGICVLVYFLQVRIDFFFTNYSRR